MRFALSLLAATLLTPAAWAQAPERHHAELHPELPSAEQPVRNVPTRSYTLSLVWTPEYCHSRREQAGAEAECGNRAVRGGFTLHGLWPDGDGPNRWPQYCKPVGILTDAQIRAGISATPSAQLLQHEWAKHGSCMAVDPVRYFEEEKRIYATIRFPDMAALAHRRGLTAGAFQSAFAAANPGMTADMMRLNVNRRGWLAEVWLCLGLDKRPKVCPAEQGGAQSGDPIKVQAAF
jgi:ribonuclease T2